MSWVGSIPRALVPLAITVVLMAFVVWLGDKEGMATPCGIRYSRATLVYGIACVLATLVAFILEIGKPLGYFVGVLIPVSVITVVEIVIAKVWFDDCYLYRKSIFGVRRIRLAEISEMSASAMKQSVRFTDTKGDHISIAFQFAGIEPFVKLILKEVQRRRIGDGCTGVGPHY